MGMNFYPQTAYEISRDYVRSFKEFQNLESYLSDMSRAAYLLSYDDDLYDEMDHHQKQKIKDLWDAFVLAFSKIHPSASIYIEYVGDECEGEDGPETNWYIGVNKRMIKNPELEDLDNVLKEISWVSWG